MAPNPAIGLHRRLCGRGRRDSEVGFRNVKWAHFSAQLHGAPCGARHNRAQGGWRRTRDPRRCSARTNSLIKAVRAATLAACRAFPTRLCTERPRRPPRPHSKRQPQWKDQLGGYGVSVSCAAAAAPAVAVCLPNAGGTAPRAPSATKAAPSQHIRLSAREISLTATHWLENRPEQTGAYWHTVGVQRTLFKVDGTESDDPMPHLKTIEVIADVKDAGGRTGTAIAIKQPAEANRGPPAITSDHGRDNRPGTRPGEARGGTRRAPG